MRRMKCLLGYFLVFFILVEGNNTSFGQTFQASITGLVTDSTGGVISGVVVTAVEQNNGFRRSTTTLDDGSYDITLLPPGLYRLTAEKQGFERADRSSLELTVNQHLKVDFQLKVGAQSTTVNVNAGAPVLETQTSSVGTTLEQTKVEEIPTNGRHFLELTLLVPGVVPGTSGSRISDRGGAINVNGMRDSMNSYWLDGLDDTAIGVGQFTVAPPLGSVQEMRMETGVYDAKFGAHAGTQMNIVTKSGGNTLHGEAYEFFRNSALDTRNFFDPTVPPFHRNQFGATAGGPVVLPGVYDGHNRTFFFSAFELLRENRSFFNRARVPTLAERGGDFSDLMAPDCTVQTLLINPLALTQGVIQPFTNINQVLPAADPVGQAMVNLYPLPNISGAACGSPNFIASVNRKINFNDFFGRVDHRWGEKNNLFFRYSLNGDYQFLPSNTSSRAASTNIPGFGTFTHDQNQMAGIDWTHEFNPTVINELKFGYNRWQIRDDNEDQGNPIAQQLGLQGLPSASAKHIGYPELNFASYDGLGAGTTDPQSGAVNTFQLADTVTEVRGNHALAFGTDLRSVERGNFSIDSLLRGQFDFTGLVSGGLGQLPPQAAQAFGCVSPTCVLGNSVADSLLGLPTDWLGGFQQSISGHLGEYDFFGQDAWRVRPNLTLSYGLRYEYKGLTTDKYNRFANFNFNQGEVMVAGSKSVTLENLDPTTGLFVPVGTTSLGGSGENRSLQQPDKDDFAPRFGFAWQPFNNTATVIRGGYGIFYNQTFGDVFFLKSANPPFVRISAGNIGAALPYIESGAFPVGSGAVISNALAGVVGPFYPTLSPFQLDFQDGMVHEWNLDVQRQLFTSWVLDIGYVGTRGLRLPFETDPNQPNNSNPAACLASPTGACPSLYPYLSGFSYTQSNGKSIYHALQVKMERHYARGLSFLGAYTYSKSIDTNSSEFTTSRDQNFPQNSMNLAAEKARSDFDYRHRLSLAYVYQLPVGKTMWQASDPNLNYLIKDWELSGVFTAQSGGPFTPQVSGDLSHADEQAVIGTGNPTDRPNLTGSSFYPATKTPNQFLLTSAFSAPAPYTFGNAGRNILTGPGLCSWDFSVIRNFRFSESTSLEFRTEIFNLLNRANFDIPQRDLASPSFGQIFNTLRPVAGLASGGPGDPREIQFGFRLMW
ncbi:MAG TPA: carboxypeptidase regulatory-like domain-containing protein [Terriglobia bacterium]|nr:carboxypeptidase regulatory-like domain-containing protein [Terriglobia bacterium]